MRISKNGFSLAELLLCIAIIGIVSAFGATVARKSTATAYNKFFQSGYVNLYNALAEVNSSGIFNTSCTQAHLAEELKKIFSTTNDNIPNGFRTKNGIQYTVDERVLDQHIYLIRMQVPQPKTRNNTNGFVNTAFLFNNQGEGFLVPLNSNQANYISLQERVDLLPFYIDNGTIGRLNATTGRLNTATSLNYRQAACRIHNKSSLSASLGTGYQLVAGNSANDWGAGAWGQPAGVYYQIVDCNIAGATQTGLLKIKL